MDEIEKVVLNEVDVNNDIAIVLVLVEEADEEIAPVVNEVVKIDDILKLEISGNIDFTLLDIDKVVLNEVDWINLVC